MWQAANSILNTVILVLILLYQIYKNKALNDRINQQNAIIEETKSIVAHQSTAIDSQGKVVESAIKYTEAFSPDKLEKIIRREMEIEKKEDVKKIKLEYANILDEKDSQVSKIEALYYKSVENSNRITNNLVSPILKSLLFILLFMDKKEQKKNLDRMQDGDAKAMTISILQDLERELANLLELAKAKKRENPELNAADALKEAAKEYKMKAEQ